MILDPETPPRVQWLEVASVPGPPSELVAIAARIVELLSEPGAAWPDDVALVEQVDRAALERAVRAAEAGFGPVELGRVLESDGEKSATWSLVGARGGKLRLELALESPHGPLTKVVLRPQTLEPPVEMD
jgi:hypothetical protein